MRQRRSKILWKNNRQKSSGPSYDTRLFSHQKNIGKRHVMEEEILLYRLYAKISLVSLHVNYLINDSGTK